MTLLTAKQKQVLELRAKGFRNKQISAMLGITEVTIHQHLRASYKRLNAKNTAHAIALASEVGEICEISHSDQSKKTNRIYDGQLNSDIILTPNEREILSSVLSGKTNLEIAEILKINLMTLEAYFARMYRRNGVSGRMNLALAALSSNQLSPASAILEAKS